MTSVAQVCPAASAAREASRLSAVMVATASGKTSPVALCRLFSTPEAERLGQGQRSPGHARVVAQQVPGVRHPGDGQAVLRLGVVDAVTAREVASGLGADLGAAAQHLGGQLERDPVARPGQEVEGDQRLATHRVDVRESVGRSDPAPVRGVVDDRGEEVGGGHDCARSVDADHRSVVARVQPDEQVVGGGTEGELTEHSLELPRRDLAGTPASGGELGQADRGGGGSHPLSVPSPPPAGASAPAAGPRRTSGRAPMPARPRRCRTG